MRAHGLSIRALASAFVFVALIYPAVAVSAPVPHDPPDNDTVPRVVHWDGGPSYLTFANESAPATGHSRAGMDLAGFVAADAARIHSEYAIRWFELGYQGSSGSAAQRATLSRQFASLDTDVARLRVRYDRALAAFNAGQLPVSQFLRELAIIDAKSRALSNTTAAFAALNARADEPVAPRRIAELKARLLPLRGPVRSHLRTELARAGESAPIYVAATGEGIVLSTITGQGDTPGRTTFLREAALGSAGDPSDSRSDVFSVLEHANAYYPVVLNETNRGPVSVGTLTGPPSLILTGIYPVAIDHAQGITRTGDLVVLFAGDPLVPIREQQYLAVSSLPTHGRVVASTADLQLAVNRTYPSGPMALRTTDAASGDSRAATVFVDGDRVGTTGTDGLLWTVEPAGATNVTVAAGGATVTTTV